MSIPQKPVVFRPGMEFVAISPWRLTNKIRLLPGDAVPKIKKHVLLWGYKTNRIGPKGAEWTDYMLRMKGFNLSATPKKKRKVKANADTDSESSEGSRVQPLPDGVE